MKYLLIAVFVIISTNFFNCYSQNLVYETDLPGILEKKMIIPFFKDINNLYSITVLQEDSVHSFKLLDIKNDVPILKHRLSDKKKYKEIEAYSNHENKQLIVFNNNSKYSRKFSLLAIDYEKDKIFESEIDFNEEREKYIASKIIDNSILILTIKINTSKLFLYKLNLSGEQLEKISIDLSENFPESDLYSNIKSILPGDYSVEVETIYTNLPQDLTSLSCKNKVYYKGNNLLLFIGEYEKKTILLSLNLKNYNYEIIDFAYPSLLCKPYKFHKHNIVLLNNTLTQFYSCKKELSFRITDINNPAKTKTYKCSPNNLQEFERGTVAFWENDKIKFTSIDKKLIKKFLRNIKKDDLYISANNLNNGLYRLSIGIYDKNLTFILPIIIGPYIGVFTFYKIKPLSIYFDLENENFNLKKSRILELEKELTLIPENMDNEWELNNSIIKHDEQEKKVKFFIKN